MTLALVGPTYPYRGGIAQFTARLAAELSQTHSVTVVNFSRLYPRLLFPGTSQYDDSFMPVAFPAERWIDSCNPFSWGRSRRRVQELRAEAVLFAWWHPFFAPSYRVIAGGLGGAARIAVCHNVLPHEGTPFHTWAVKAFLRKTDGVVVHSFTDQEAAAALAPNLPRLRLYHPTYDVFPSRYASRGEARRALNLAPEARVVLYFGLVRPYKGVEVLLDATRLLGDVADLKVLVVGEIYGDREKVRRSAEGLAGTVQLVDRFIPNEEVAAYFLAADVVVLPYIAATQSGVVPLAYHFGRPVIVTNVGGLPETVLPGRSGYLVPPADPRALAEEIRRFFSTKPPPDLSAGIEEMRRRLSWAGYATSLVEFCARVIAGLRR